MKAAMHHAEAIEIARQRICIAGAIMIGFFLIVAGRLFDVMIVQGMKRQNIAQESSSFNAMPRADIYDRNGNIVATHLVTASVYANPKVLINPDQAAKKLATLFPEISYKTLRMRLGKGKGFTWLIRHISPKMQKAVNELGIPGVYLQKDYKRVYPYGNLLSHALGYCGMEDTGLAGIEKHFDEQLRDTKKSLHLSLDVRVQHIVRDVLLGAIQDFKAQGANAMVMDLKTGQLLAMVSLPDFNPHQVGKAAPQMLFNRNTLGVNEPGSTWKILNTAIALETEVANPRSSFDATAPIKIGRFTITDFKGKNRVLSMTEAFVYSSNIASIKIAQRFGANVQRSYFKKFGVFKPTRLELPEVGSPLIPRDWTDVTMMTASYGYGISVTPLQLLSIIGSIINDGVRIQPTLIDTLDKTQNTQHVSSDERIVSPKTSRTIRELMRLTAMHGGSRKANIDGYEVFAKTGTAYQNKGRGGYNRNDRTTFCVGAFPFHDPQIMVVVMLDSPQPTKETYNYAAAGWNAAPTLGRVIERIAPMLGILPVNENSVMRNVTWYDGENEFIRTSHVTSGHGD